jgi:hypothetical protein
LLLLLLLPGESKVNSQLHAETESIHRQIAGNKVGKIYIILCQKRSACKQCAHCTVRLFSLYSALNTCFVLYMMMDLNKYRSHQKILHITINLLQVQGTFILNSLIVERFIHSPFFVSPKYSKLSRRL